MSTNQPINQVTSQLINNSTNQLVNYTLHLADTTLILSQRNSEWCGHGPALEQDIAISNISLDLLGQSRNFYQYAAKLSGDNVTEDSLAYHRNERDFKNLLITELPNGDWAQTTLRQFFISAFYNFLFDEMQSSADVQLAAIAEKSLKEVAYHVKWSAEWVIRLGDGTDESRQRLLAALEELWPYTGEMFIATDYEETLINSAIIPSLQKIKTSWQAKVAEIFEQAELPNPVETFKKSFMQTGGKQSVHTEHLGFILAEMQYLQRMYPDAEW